MQKKIIIILIISLFSVLPLKTSAVELYGYATAEGQLFFDDPLYPGQREHSVSLSAQPEFYHQWESGSSFTFTPFMRVDSADPERSHIDIRELNFLWLIDKYELRIGAAKVFWGVTETWHLVDIINQTDLVEDIDAEDKLGQPMISLTLPFDWGTVSTYVMPYFRERTFPGRKGRFRSPFFVDTGRAIYESSAKEYHLDAAVRYSHSIGSLDIGLTHFYGTGREPTLLPGFTEFGEPVLVPYYEIINQTGLDMLFVAGQWLWKLESIYRTGQADEDFFALTGGFEYTLVNIAGTGLDIGILTEWLYDQREEKATTIFDNDIMSGIRLEFNDMAGTRALTGIIQDLDSRGTVFTFESSRRIGNSLRAGLDAFFVLDSSEEDPVHQLRRDDSVKIELSYYF